MKGHIVTVCLGSKPVTLAFNIVPADMKTAKNIPLLTRM